MDLSSRKWISRGGVFWSVFLVAAVYVGTLCILQRQGLWIVDNENRFLQVQALVDNGFSEYAIRWPGKQIDPDFEFNPIRFDLAASFHQVKDGQLISVFQPAFIVASAGLFAVFGHWGLYILPLVCAVLMLAGVAQITRVLKLKPPAQHLAVLLAGLCTPLWFYSQVFWEHTTAACLCVWGVHFHLRFMSGGAWRDLAAGCLLLAFAIFFRDVLGLFYLALLGLTLLQVRQNRRKILLISALVLTAGVALLLLFQWATVGRPLGFHVGTLLSSASGIAEHFNDRLKVLYIFFVASHLHPWWSIVIASPFVLAFLIRPRLSRKNFVLAVPVCALLGLVAGFFFLKGFLDSGNPLRNMLAANSFFVASPVLILAFLRLKGTDTAGSGPRLADLLLAATSLYAVVYCFTAPQLGAASLHWGGRPIFALYPLFAILAVTTLARWFDTVGHKIRLQAVIVGLLILLSFTGQIYSVHILAKKKDFSFRANEQIRKYPQQVVITNIWWGGHELYSAFHQKSIFYVQTQEQFNELEARLRKNGHREFVFVTRTRPGLDNPAAVKVNDGGLNFYSLNFFVSRIEPGSG